MDYRRKPAKDFTIEELDRELIARGAKISSEQRLKFKDMDGTHERTDIMLEVEKFYNNAASLSENSALRHLETWQLAKALMNKTRTRIKENDDTRGIWYDDKRKDLFQVEDDWVRENSKCVAALCYKSDLLPVEYGYSQLRTKTFGEAFNLCPNEPFCDQPVSVGRMSTGFLVKEDVIATAAHCIDERRFRDLRFLFGFKMLNSLEPVTQVPNKNIYHPIELLNKVHNRKSDKSDWALVKLDRKVTGQRVAALPEKDINCNQSVYVLGHPCGLPLKYAYGGTIQAIEKAYFSADLDIFSGNSGSPAFNSETHEVIGIVVRGDNRDFRWTGKGWMSVIYPNPVLKSNHAQCTRISELVRFCR